MTLTTTRASVRSGWRVAVQTGAVLAAAMGVGRFVFTPILPLMEAQAGLPRQSASLLATGNYLGYLAGAVLGIAVPALSRSRTALRISGIALVSTLVGMPLAGDVASWTILRTVAGVASAVVFVVAGNAILTELASSRPHLVGWAYGGVGAGIAFSGVLVTVVRQISDWQAAWWAAAALTAGLLAAGWRVGERSRPPVVPAPGAVRESTRHTRWFVLLSASYFLEGAGYIIAGTFLVAAVDATASGRLAGSVWTVVGVAAAPSCALWTWLSTRVSRPTLITGGLLLQAVGIALPAISGSSVAAIVSATLFGATFVGVTTLSLATGRHLGVPGAVAVLTAGYSVGQVVGPLAVTPLLTGGYRSALLVGAAVVLAAALASALMRIRFPHRDQPHHRARRAGVTPPAPDAAVRVPTATSP